MGVLVLAASNYSVRFWALWHVVLDSFRLI